MKRATPPPARWVFSDPLHFLAFGFGSGLAPVAPGTFGTLAAVPLYLLIQSLPLSVYILLTLAVTAVGPWICGRAARALGVHDHPGIVWDEVAGFLITMIAAPGGWFWMVIGFTLFRLFDVLKPWPCSWADRQVTGGTGIMLDDVIAGIYAALVLQVLARLLPV